MKRSVFAVLSSALCLVALQAAASESIPLADAREVFAQARSICEQDAGKLWGVSLCGPIMLVDPKSRQLIANQADANGALKARDGVFVGLLPAEQNVANTAVEWSGTRWTQMLWPLHAEPETRGTLIAHELFHRIQPQLKLPKLESGENAHLDTLDGRYWLQLEWRALARALQAGDDAARRQAAADALLFRAERYRLFTDAAAQEQELEQNEGLAEYTGVMAGNATEQARVQAALHDLSAHVGSPSFVRSFAYATGPAYGLLLDRYAAGWRQQLAGGLRFDATLRQALASETPADVQGLADQRALRYDGAALRVSETQRDIQRQQVLAANRRKFVDGPVLLLPFQHMKVQFNPSNLQPLGEHGTVYPTMRISDDWGVLEASDGALMRSDWSAVTVVAPEASAGSDLKGEGWTLQLKPGWRLVPGSRKGDLVLEQPAQ
ncbi:hypothetical protein IP90_02692 [Luteimonas cucumeris]|uniref:Uncharacterized protein n=1 Tax=Luteimonas cucumeris TaxID=985012 RepID=A0A562L064_9GAMM|nr:hypothetical protein [Luteimonas cucumeris]TWI01070.1 hypothetical protein IP90_02692 [Luteimonas cucumeris]